jgi:hypothetical protein
MDTKQKSEDVFKTINLIKEAIKADTTCWLFVGKKMFFIFELNEFNVSKF